MFRKLRQKRGFTLVEIMIVVAIIGLLVAIAIPNLLRARLSANEAAAKASLRTIITALENYRADQNPPSYPTALTTLSTATPPYLDPVIAGGQKQGYTFAYATDTAVTLNIGGTSVDVIPAYSLGASPVKSNVTGNATFYANSTGVIYADTTSPYTSPGTSYSGSAPSGFLAIGN